MVGNLDESTYITLLDEPNTKSKLGVLRNKIIEVPNFVTPEIAEAMVKYFEMAPVEWGDIAFYNSWGMGLPDSDEEGFRTAGLPNGFFSEIRTQYQACVEAIFGDKVRPNTSHAQKWGPGGFAPPHSDNSDFDGNPTAFEINKYVGILYLNDSYTGGELYFPEHDIEFKPNAYSYYVFPGGVENIHGVRTILEGERYTMVSFWDFADAEYSEERKAEWEAEFAKVRSEQAEQRVEWSQGNHDA